MLLLLLVVTAAEAAMVNPMAHPDFGGHTF
jgi:hypothetical protein